MKERKKSLDYDTSSPYRVGVNIAWRKTRYHPRSHPVTQLAQFNTAEPQLCWGKSLFRISRNTASYLPGTGRRRLSDSQNFVGLAPKPKASYDEI